MVFERFKQRFRKSRSGGTNQSNASLSTSSTPPEGMGTELHAAEDPLQGSPSLVEAHDPPPEPVDPELVASSAIDPASYPLSSATSSLDVSRPTAPTGLAAAPESQLRSEESKATAPSLWDRAYDLLRENEPDLVIEYERLLSHELPVTEVVATPTASNNGLDNTTGKIFSQSPEGRRRQLKTIIDCGLRRMEERKTTYTIAGHKFVLEDQIAKVADFALWTKDFVAAAVNASPEASLAWAGVCIILPILTSPRAAEQANGDGFAYVTSRLRYYVELEHLLWPRNLESKDGLQKEFEDHIVDLYQHILDFQLKSVLRFYRSWSGKLLRDVSKSDDWKEKLSHIKNLETIVNKESKVINTLASRQALESVSDNANASLKVMQNLLSVAQEQVHAIKDQTSQQEKIHHDAEDNKCLRDLHVTDPHLDKIRIEQTKGNILPHSCWILDHTNFRQWREDPSRQLLWIRGNPGKGKTMLVSGIINTLHDTKKMADSESDELLSYFFCQATNNQINSATSVLRGLIWLLVNQQPSLIQHVRKEYDRVGKDLFEGTNSWVALTVIFQNVLSDASLVHTYLVVDALDECVVELPKLLDLISRSLSFPTRVKWLLSSRNEPGIEQKLDKHAQINLELEENAKYVSRTVDRYIDHRLSEITSLADDIDLRGLVRGILHQKANGTFLWVALVVQELAEAKGWEVLKVAKQLPSGLYGLYDRMLGQIQGLRRNSELCYLVLATAVATYRPLHLEEIGVLSGLPSEIHEFPEHIHQVVKLCGSFLTIQDNQVYLVHQSAKDYLVAKAEKAYAMLFPFGIANIHRAIFTRSLERMSCTLKRDMYNLGRPGCPIDDARPSGPDPLAAVRYSCVYWVDHLCDSKEAGQDPNLEDGSTVYTFLSKKFLYWLEALSLLRSVSEGVVATRKLNELFTHSSDQQLTGLVRDMLRFILSHRLPIETAPLQTYASALVFSPVNSVVRKLFEVEEPSWITVKPKVEDHWSACLQTLEGHDDTVDSVAFSPDGKQLASGSDDKTVRLWDIASGICLQTLEGHTDEVISVAFSPDGKQLASGSSDKTVRLWDIASGVCLQTLEGHTDEVNSVAFSPDGKQLASGSDDKTVRLWDIASGVCLQTLEGHTDEVNSVAFSPDGKQLASGSSDETVRLWDIASGICLQTLEGHTNEVNSVAFSPDGKQLASGSDDETVRLWDIALGVCLQMLEGHRHWVNSVAFSPDGKQLASGSDDETVRLWDIASGICLQALEGHTNEVNSAAFSPDGKQLASGSDDETVRLWDIASGIYLQTLEGHTDEVNSVAFSPDGKQLASGSNDKTVRLWDIASGICLQTLEGHYGWINSVAFSPDGKQLASGSNDKTVRLWGIASSICLQTLQGHRHRINSVAFSPDGKQLASSSFDSTVRLWDTASGTCLQIIPVSGLPSSLSFDADFRLSSNLGLIDLDLSLLSVKAGKQGSTDLDLDDAQGQAQGTQLLPEPCWSVCGVEDHWIMRGGERLLWLPPNWRPDLAQWNNPVMSFMGRTLSIGCESGRVLIIGFAHDA